MNLADLSHQCEMHLNVVLLEPKELQLCGELWCRHDGSLQNLSSFLPLHLNAKASQLLALSHMAVPCLPTELSHRKGRRIG